MSKWAEVLARAGKAYARDKCTLLAGGITYYTLIALFPLLLFALSIIGYVLTDEVQREDFIDYILDQIPLEQGEGRSDLRELIESVVSARGTLGIIGLLGAAWTGSSLFSAVRNSLNLVFDVKEGRNFFKGKALDLAWVLSVGLLLILSVGATFGITLLQRFATDLLGGEVATGVRLLLTLANVLLPTVISAFVFFVLYVYVAHAPIPWRHCAIGAVFAAIGFEVLKTGFAWYVANFGNYNATYGTLGFIIIFLLFIFLGSQVMLFGGELVVEHYRVSKGQPASEKYDSEVTHLRNLARKGISFAPGVKLEPIEERQGWRPPHAREDHEMSDQPGRPEGGAGEAPEVKPGEQNFVGRISDSPGEAFGDPGETHPYDREGEAMPVPRTGGREGGGARVHSAGASGNMGAGRYAMGAAIVAVWVAIVAGLGFLFARKQE